MLDKIPNAEEMIALVGQSLYDIWNKLCMKSMIWNACGTTVVKRGLMSINTVVVEKRFVHCTQEKTA